MADEVPQRAELMAPYRHPWRACGREVWRDNRGLRAGTVVGGASTAIGVAGLALGPQLWGVWAVLGVLILGYMAFLWAWVTAGATLPLLRAWRQRSVLRDVLEKRPHAGSEDPDLVHDLFAVTVEDDGWLYTWRYRPLAWDEQPGLERVEVPGRPRYEAEVILERRFDARDAARAAEQLVEAQEGAARREALAAAQAAHVVERAALSEHDAEEARTTAAALQRSTGQRSRRS
jgi:hypothetical protein